MAELIKFGNTSNIIEFIIKDSTTGQGKKGLSLSTSGLIISTKCDNETTPTVYTQAGSTIETITTLGTFAAPTSSKCRFKEVSSTNHPGLYQFQFADARFAISSAKRLIISINDAESAILDTDYQIQLVQFDPYDTIHLGLTAIPNTACTNNASLITSGTGTDQLSVASGRIDLGKILGTASAGAAGSVGIDWAQIINKTSTNALTGTTIASTQQVDINTIKTQTVTCPAPITVNAFVGNATAALSVDSSGRIDLGKILGTASAGVAGYIGIDWSHINAPTTSVNLSGTTISTSQQVDLNTIKTQTVTCSAGVTVNPNLGTTQPINFTGTSTSALIKTDVTDWATHSVSVDTNNNPIMTLAATGTSAVKESSGTYDIRQLLTMMWEMLMAGKISGLPTSPATIRTFDDSADRAHIAFDSNNNRTSFTVNTTPT